MKLSFSSSSIIKRTHNDKLIAQRKHATVSSYSSSSCNIIQLMKWLWDQFILSRKNHKNWSVARLFLFILDRPYSQKRTTKFYWKNLLLRTLNIYFNIITTTSVGWPTVVTGKHKWLDLFGWCRFLLCSYYIIQRFILPLLMSESTLWKIK